jgi:hypothetical protein
MSSAALSVDDAWRALAGAVVRQALEDARDRKDLGALLWLLSDDARLFMAFAAGRDTLQRWKWRINVYAVARAWHPRKMAALWSFKYLEGRAGKR